MPTVTNIAAYKFANLSNLKPLREQLAQSCKAKKLKGTILLSEEGINLFVAGGHAETTALLDELRSVPGLEGLQAKISESDDQPFHRMLVKIKKEIISFGVEGIDPVERPAPKIAARELKQWLDEGRSFVLLDTRNEYEVRLGTFQRATTLKIDHFRQFPDAVRQLPETLKHQPVVMFCTGGIRCEKAGPFMQREGFEEILQLDGGILKYFEECGDAHYDGECFVFDHRVGLDPNLQESSTKQCFACQSPLTEADQADSRFVEGQTCPYCFTTTMLQRDRMRQERQDAIQRAATPLPGSAAYENYRPLNIPQHYDGMAMLDFLTGVFDHIRREEWALACQQGRIRRRSRTGKRCAHDELAVEEYLPVDGDKVVRAGERYLHVTSAMREPDVNAEIRILYEDEAILVIDKPAPLPMHPCGRYCRNTLQYILSQVYKPQSPRPAHRLDANTTGIVVFAKTKHFAKRLQRQFEPNHEQGIEKRYLARVVGHPVEDHFSCDRPITGESGPPGSHAIDGGNGLPARTEFKVLQRFQDGTSLLEVTPLTGRTNQIRIHLWSLSFPICGDSTYRGNQTLGDSQTLNVGDPPLCLKAHRIEFTHPINMQRVGFETELPVWATPVFHEAQDLV